MTNGSLNANYCFTAHKYFNHLWTFEHAVYIKSELNYKEHPARLCRDRILPMHGTPDRVGVHSLHHARHDVALLLCGVIVFLMGSCEVVLQCSFHQVVGNASSPVTDPEEMEISVCRKKFIDNVVLLSDLSRTLSACSLEFHTKLWSSSNIHHKYSVLAWFH